MPQTPIPLKIAYIGGGSRGWAHILMNDLAICPDLTGEVRLYDIDLEAARLNERLGNWIHTQPGAVSTWRYRTVATPKEALQGADFVFISIQPGSLEMMAHEIAVSEKYGMFFPVGDTTGTPGLMRALRSTITFAGFAESIVETCPEAWVINYTNPMTVCTRTLTRVAPGLKVFGCCHEVFGTQDILGRVAQKYLELPEPPARDEIRVNVLGINHFTWIDKAAYQSHDLLAMLKRYMEEPGVRRPFTQAEVVAQNSWFADNLQIKLELFERFGILAAAGDRHLSEFLPGFTRSPEELFRWGVIRTPVSYRIERWKLASQMVMDYLDGRRPLEFTNTGEEAIRQIKALLGLGDFVTNVNLENAGQINNLPLHAVVETNARFSQNEVRPLAAGALPPGVQSLVARHVTNQELIITAALEQDRELAFQIIFNDPTMTLPIDQAWKMFNEISPPDNFFRKGVHSL